MGDYSERLDTPRQWRALLDRVERVERAARGVPVLTALPADPFDGDTIDYVANATKGVVWRLRYRAAATGSYKWEVVGGSALVEEVAAGETTTSTTFAALTTAGPSITVPLAGDYDVEVGSRQYATSNSRNLYHSFDVGGTGAVDGDGTTFYTGTSYDGLATVAPNQTRLRRKTGLAASTALVSKYRTTGGTAEFDSRWMRVRPVRVG